MMTGQCWIDRFPQSTTSLRLFCFPCAGGGASAYRAWHAELPGGIELCPIQLPGRESRYRERPFESLDTLVLAIADAIAPWLDRSYAFFGHSMGGLVAFELARELRRRGLPEPRHLFVAGITPPRPRVASRSRHQLNDVELLDELRRFGGTPARLLDEPEVVRLLLPVLRADLAVVETYHPRLEPPLSVPIAAFAGAWDPEAPPDAMADWRAQTDAAFQLMTFAGDHFFLHGGAVRRALIGQVARVLFESVSHAA
jgi:medium-chain acyl-[acyl-carrier-protein] hydrolase